MQFQTRPRFFKPSTTDPDGAYLIANNWDDFGYRTLWGLWVVREGQPVEVGYVKIGSVSDSASRPAVPDSFETLPQGFFSLGQDEDFYDNLNKLGDIELRAQILVSLRDVALDLDLFEQVLEYEITTTSLLRSIKHVTVRTQFHRLALGGVRLSPYSFSYTTSGTNRLGELTEPATLHFDVDPESNPKSNVHVIVGRNGVGKSFILHDITTALTKPGQSAGELDFHKTGDDRLVNRFTNVVSVAFSAFDAFEPLRDQSSHEESVHYTYIGLKTVPKSATAPTTVKDHVALASQFGMSLKKCLATGRLDRWQRTLDFLRSDPLFAELVDRLVELEDDAIRDQAREVFSELSSGHKIVLLTLTKLVEAVEEATLVLLDEPESHLHPPLLSAFMRSLSDLLESRNAAAIIVTHSPVVVQEVPSECVYIVNTIGASVRASRPTLPTYGENVGTLTQEIFGLEVTASGFHSVLSAAVNHAIANEGDYQSILELFNHQLGGEARALVQTMLYLSARRA